MPDLYLHIGYPKTGTSSIQVFLRDNPEALSALGYYVPQVGQGKAGGHHTLVRTLVGLPVAPHQAVAESDIRRELAAAGDKSVLISSEMLTAILANPKHASTLFGKFRAAGLNVILLVYARNQTQWINSSYSQSIKSFRLNGDFASFLDSVLTHQPGYTYNKWLEIAPRHDAELRVRPFSKEVRDGGVVEDYCRTIGIPASTLAPFPRVNESAGPLMVETARRLMAWVPGGAEALTFMQSTRSKLALDRQIQLMRIQDGSYCGLDEATAARVEALFLPENDRFATAVWDSDWSTIFGRDLGQKFGSNDYNDTGVPPDMQAPLDQMMATMQGEMTAILKNPRLGVRNDWNARRA